MQKYFAMKWRILHSNPGANVGAIAPLIKCKVPFGNARGPGAGSKPPYELYTREIWPGGTLQRVG
jgi:hypothetical protein